MSVVVVPTNRHDRPRPGLGHAKRIAEDHDVPLIILRSGAALEVAPSFSHVPGTGAVVVDLTPEALAAVRAALPPLSTDTHLASQLGGDNDLGLKQNVATVVARLAGWRVVCSLHDDMRETSPDGAVVAGPPRRGRQPATPDFDAALAHLAGHPTASVVCWTTSLAPDHSEVGHVRRAVGGSDGTYGGAGALLTRADAELPFVPSCGTGAGAWLFFFACVLRSGRPLPSPTVVCGGTAFQEPTTRLDAELAAAEELGDLLAESLLDLLRRHAIDAVLDHAATTGHWRVAARERRSLLVELLHGACEEHDRAHAALLAALDVHARLGDRLPRVLAAYVRAWIADLERWDVGLDRLTPGEPLGIREALRRVGLEPYARVLVPRGRAPREVFDRGA
jgi:hypothetical protein